MNPTHQGRDSQQQQQQQQQQQRQASDSHHHLETEVTSPAAASDSTAGFGFPSATETSSADLVFPIRSAVTVDPAAATSAKSGADNHDNRQRSDIRNTASSTSRRDTLDTRGAPTPLSPHMPSPIGSPAGRSKMATRSRGQTGPLSSIQADAARHGPAAPVDLGIGATDDASETSSALDHEHAGSGQGRAASHISETPSSADVPLATTRFTYVQTDDGHAVITGRDEVLQQCEDEPIHTPGAVQDFGCLVAIQEQQPSGDFLVRYVSENSERLIGYSPRSLFRKKSFTDIFSEDQQDNLLDHIDFIRDEDSDPAINGPEVVGVTVRHPKLNKSFKLWCALHINMAHPELIICEFELDDDTQHPLRPPSETTPEPPIETLQSHPTKEDIETSTEVASKPLRILRSARKRRGEQGAMQVFDILSQVQEQLAAAPTLEQFLKILVGIIKELTGFHRVMIYQFDSSFNGKVVTELVDTSQTLDLYKGLHFPASDIPRQARELYKINKVRLLYDRDQTTARVVCRSQEDLDVPLDMTHAYLRAMSPIHLKYLKNMEVRSSMSISINAFNELWGLISCHAYGNHGMRVSFPTRKLCRLVGETASRNIERLSYASRLQARKLINTSPTDKNPSGYIIASSDDLLRLFDADCGLLYIRDETKVLGTMHYSREALALLEYLRMRQLTSVTACQDVKQDFPDLRYAPGFQVIAGLLYVPLSVGGDDFIVFFRKGQEKEVKWAGNPYEKDIRQGTECFLEPRASFKQWNETIVGKCREWDEEQVETASVLCLVYGT
jgi:light-regulated signal transduction histidine kinase (bacteriophytochrome)